MTKWKSFDITFKGRGILKAYLYLINRYDQTHFLFVFHLAEKKMIKVPGELAYDGLFHILKMLKLKKMFQLQSLLSFLV